MVQPLDRGVERALGGERADVQLVDDRAGQRRPRARRSVRPANSSWSTTWLGSVGPVGRRRERGSGRGSPPSSAKRSVVPGPAVGCRRHQPPAGGPSGSWPDAPSTSRRLVGAAAPRPRTAHASLLRQQRPGRVASSWQHAASSAAELARSAVGPRGPAGRSHAVSSASRRLLPAAPASRVTTVITSPAAPETSTCRRPPERGERAVRSRGARGAGARPRRSVRAARGRPVAARLGRGPASARVESRQPGADAPRSRPAARLSGSTRERSTSSLPW